MYGRIILVAAFATITISHDVTVGNNSNGRKIFDEKREASPAIWRQVQNVTVNTTNDEVISKVVVTDLRPEKDGDVQIVDGGEGQKTVTLELKSPTVLRGYDFQIEVYAIPDKKMNNKEGKSLKEHVQPSLTGMKSHEDKNTGLGQPKTNLGSSTKLPIEDNIEDKESEVSHTFDENKNGGKFIPRGLTTHDESVVGQSTPKNLNNHQDMNREYQASIPRTSIIDQQSRTGHQHIAKDAVMNKNVNTNSEHLRRIRDNSYQIKSTETSSPGTVTKVTMGPNLGLIPSNYGRKEYFGSTMSTTHGYDAGRTTQTEIPIEFDNLKPNPEEVMGQNPRHVSIDTSRTIDNATNQPTSNSTPRSARDTSHQNKSSDIGANSHTTSTTQIPFKHPQNHNTNQHEKPQDTPINIGRNNEHEIHIPITYENPSYTPDTPYKTGRVGVLNDHRMNFGVPLIRSIDGKSLESSTDLPRNYDSYTRKANDENVQFKTPATTVSIRDYNIENGRGIDRAARETTGDGNKGKDMSAFGEPLSTKYTTNIAPVDWDIPEPVLKTAQSGNGRPNSNPAMVSNHNQYHTKFGDTFRTATTETPEENYDFKHKSVL